MGTLLVLLGLCLFGYKLLFLELPVFPTNPEGVWQVELRVTARGEGPGTIAAALPSNDDHQIVFDETSSSDGLSLAIDHDGPGRVGVWSGSLQGVHRIAYSFRVRLSGKSFSLPSAPAIQQIPPSIAAAYLSSEPQTPASSREVIRTLDAVEVPGADDPAGRLRTIYAFIDHRIATEDGGSDDALLTLVDREGSPLGKARLLVTMLRASGLPARLVTGLRLQEETSPNLIHWVECWLGESWVPMSPTGDFFAKRPQDLLQLRYDVPKLVEPTKVVAQEGRFTSLRERLGPRQLANMMIPDNAGFASVSLYRLPVSTQKALRLLLLLPIGALIISAFRNFIGFRTFGTFMPILIGLALRETSLITGLSMLAIVIGVGVIMRRFLDGLRLLVVPRISFLLCVVILVVVGLALLAEGMDDRNFFSGVVFPIIVITMLIERFSLVLQEEGLRESLKRTFYSVLIAIFTYPIFKSTIAEHLMFGFPELVFVIMGLLIFIGGYTGFRLTDYLRFRVLVAGGTTEEIPGEVFGLEPTDVEEQAGKP